MSYEISYAQAARRLGISRQRLDQLMHPDKRRARGAVTRACATGALPEARNLRCLDCGKWATEYDHYLGYALEHRLDVQPVCRKCHECRGRVRRELALDQFVAEMRVRMDASGIQWADPPRGPRHGLRSTYNRGCRCEPCRTSNAVARRAFLEKNRGRPRVHGNYTSYSNYGCRCRPCTKAWSAHCREYKQRHRQQRVAA